MKQSAYHTERGERDRTPKDPSGKNFPLSSGQSNNNRTRPWSWQVLQDETRQQRNYETTRGSEGMDFRILFNKSLKIEKKDFTMHPQCFRLKRLFHCEIVHWHLLTGWEYCKLSSFATTWFDQYPTAWRPHFDSRQHLPRPSRYAHVPVQPSWHVFQSWEPAQQVPQDH